MAEFRVKCLLWGAETKLNRKVRSASRNVRRLLGQALRKSKWLLRAIGFRTLNYIGKGRKKPEEAKEVLQESFGIALSRCGVHLAPMLVFAWLLTINCKTFFLGTGLSFHDRYDFLYLALYQIAAKLQEMLCIASLSTTLVEILRSDLLHGDGTSFGLISSHLWFVQPNSLFNPEYLSAALESIDTLRRLLFRHTSHQRFTCTAFTRQRRRQLLLVLFVPVLVVLAALIGPFTAVLMIPRSQ